MVPTLEIKVTARLNWVITLLLYCAIPLFLTLGLKGFHQFNKNPMRWLLYLTTGAPLFIFTITFARQIGEIRIAEGQLHFRTIGRLPLIPFGPESTVFEVPVGSEFIWRDNYLLVKVQGTYVYQFSIGVSKKRLAQWFQENGLTQPI